MEFDIPFNKPYLAGPEMDYMQEAVNRLKLSGNGKFSQECHQFFVSNTALENVCLPPPAPTPSKWRLYC